MPLSVCRKLPYLMASLPPDKKSAIKMWHSTTAGQAPNGLGPPSRSALLRPLVLDRHVVRHGGVCYSRGLPGPGGAQAGSLPSRSPHCQYSA